MAFRVEVTPEARQDANGILEWLHVQEAGDAGLHWFRGLSEAIASLSALPKRCALVRENASVPFEMRQLLYGHKPHLYRILFTIEGDVVHVLRIRHGRRRRLDEPHTDRTCQEQ
jgi:plasmid stabilization system protein ParE